MMSEESSKATWINPLAGKKSVDVMVTNHDTADVRPTGSNDCPDFLAPTSSGAMKSTDVLQVVTLINPAGSKDVSLEDQVTHYVGLPVNAFDLVDGSNTVRVSGFKGYWLAPGENSQAAKDMLVKCDPKAGFDVMLDRLWDQFRNLFFTQHGYKGGDGPTEMDLEYFMCSVQAAYTRAKTMARDGASLKKMGIVETTFVVAESEVVLPAKYVVEDVASPIVFQLTEDSSKLVDPDYFGTTAVRLGWTEFWETCKHFGLGPVAPLLLKAYFDAYGIAGTETDLTSFLETTLARINTSGKFVYGVNQGSKATGLTKAERDSVIAIMYEVFENLILYESFLIARENLSSNQMFFDFDIKWSSEFAEDYGSDIVATASRIMSKVGIPTNTMGGTQIKAWPFASVRCDLEGTRKAASLKAASEFQGTFSLQPLRLKPIDEKIELLPMMSYVPTIGWTKAEDGSFVSRGHTPAKFDPEVGLVVDTEIVSFLDLSMEGEAYAGWVRQGVTDSPQMYRLAVTRATNHRFNLGLGPMTVLDPLVGRNPVFKGNVVPFVLPGPPAGLKGCEAGTYVISPKELFAKQADGKDVDPNQ